jgi:hypothetical protein
MIQSVKETLMTMGAQIVKYRVHKDSDPAMAGVEPGDLLILHGFANEITVNMRDEGEANEVMHTWITINPTNGIPHERR